MLWSTVFTKLGFSHHLLGGECKWLAEGPSIQVMTAISELPDSEEGFLQVDLDAHAAAGALSAEHFSALKGWQCERIRALRAAAYQAEADGLFFNAEADGPSRDVWLAKRTEIKSRYPWPGTYR
ncbi:MAG: hypothetical protein HY914_05155 [Desulfomonile tiedjei]|nr:hypothetical protein [Desulfomonile tiedjei]